ncbi:MAG TPA: glycosyltransferase family 39 protein, partial [Candidatus Deferrimicrobiaceae bacterium]
MGTFAVGLGNQFVWDDVLFIVNNDYLHDPRNIPRFLLSGDAAGTGLLNPYYRPLATATFAIDYAIWGEQPAGFHATNIALHLLTCLVLYRVICHITGNPSASLAATLLFAVHPAHSEPVGYISARADILCALFILLSFLGFLLSRETGKRSYLALSIVAFTLALLSKIVALVLPPLLGIYMLLSGKREGWAKSLVPLAAVSVGFLILRSWVLKMEVWGPIPFSIRVANAGLFLLDYFQNALLPVGLKVFYDPDLKMSPTNIASIASWAG